MGDCFRCGVELTAENTAFEKGGVVSDPYSNYESEPKCDACVGAEQDAYLDRINEM